MINKTQLKNAIRRKEFIVVYQPIVALADGHCVGAEVLVRWQRENGALLPPDRFLPAARRHSCLDAITDLVLDQAIAQTGAMLRDHPGLHLAINIPAHDINSGRILDIIGRKLSGTGIASAQLWLEVTEGSSMESPACMATLSRARGNGHLVALDDFGTGYSCLRYLHELPCDVLKLDRSFVSRIGVDATPHPVTTCIIELARQLKLRIVAEGVETPVQASYLKQAGVDYAQGWFFARPMLAPDFLRHCACPGAVAVEMAAASTVQLARPVAAVPALEDGEGPAVGTSVGAAEITFPLSSVKH
ncbi:EAL domain-containing protein [Herbaspirillum sp.]|uniref:EAL domain-containing protein n=1 Tax=Herbaspirillum sp. TaxID=1890675 RepID=UPI0031D86E6D